MTNFKKAIQKSKEQGAKSLRNFCDSTSLHGYNYLYIVNSVVLKVFCLGVFAGMTSLGVYLLVDHTNEYLRNKIVTSIESYTAPLSVIIILNTYVIL